MENLKTIWNTFWKDNGFKHLSVFLFFAYCVVFWGKTDYASTTLMFPSSMFHSLATQIFWQQIILIFVGAGLINGIYEWFLGKTLEIPFSIPDCIWAGVGGVLGALLFEAFPQNKFLLITFVVAILATFVYIILIFRKKWKN